MARRLLSGAEVDHRRGSSKSTRYEEIKNGLFIPPVHISQRTTRYPEYEVDAIIAARIAGAADDEIRTLVRRLVEARKDALSIASATDEEIRAFAGGLVANCLKGAAQRRGGDGDGDGNDDEAATSVGGAAQ